MKLIADPVPGQEIVLSPPALEFVSSLEKRFGDRRRALLQTRADRQMNWDLGKRPEFLSKTANIRGSAWTVAPPPPDLERRWVEITGPAEPKMIIGALNSGADVYMADFEDSLSPTWNNLIRGQLALREAVEGSLTYRSPEGKIYRLGDQRATLKVRPRGWHLDEKNALFRDSPVSGSLFDFGLFLFHNARSLLQQRSGPYFYLPKLESHEESALWNEVFEFSERAIDLPQGSIRATVLIETLPAAFEMDEILFSLRDRICGLNAGRWDYIFSIIKKFRNTSLVLPDRRRITMDLPFMTAYCDLLVRTCHQRGAHAIGGMSAFIPSRKDVRVNEIALAQVRKDKQREVQSGFDGSWVAHPDLVPLVRGIFDQGLRGRAHQKEKLPEVSIHAEDLLNFEMRDPVISEAGVLQNMEVASLYLEHWLKGTGAVALHHLMEDAATAEISRAQLWQWIHRKAPLQEGGRMDRDRYLRYRERVTPGPGRDFLDRLALSPEFEEFFTTTPFGPGGE